MLSASCTNGTSIASIPTSTTGWAAPTTPRIDVADVFRALSHIDSYEDKGLPFSAWLYRIAHNLMANWHRDRARRPVVALDDLVTRSLPEEHPEF